MKANELMQGNLVLYEYNGEKIHARVVEIYRSSALVESVTKEYEPIEIAEDKLFPIAITPEILEKNGFAHYEEDEESFHNEDCVLLKQSSGGYGICVDKNRTISGLFYYVHQLQHALLLCGIEKEIEL